MGFRVFSVVVGFDLQRASDADAVSIKAAGSSLTMFGGDISIDLRGGMGDVPGVIHVNSNFSGLLLLPYCE